MESLLPLQNKWIVNTRAEHQAQPLNKKLSAAGANAISFPLLSIEAPANPKKIEHQLESLEDYDLAIFISTNAVEQTLNKINSSVLKSLKLACTGSKTALALKESGQDIDFCPERFFNSETLLAMDSFQEFIPGKKIAIIKGEGGRNLLTKTLQKWGGDVHNIDVYRRACPQHNLDLLKIHKQREELDIILLTSGFSVYNFFALAGSVSDTNADNYTEKNEWINSLTLLLGSERLKKYIPSAFKGKVIFTEDPNDDTLLKELAIVYESI